MVVDRSYRRSRIVHLAVLFTLMVCCIQDLEAATAGKRPAQPIEPVVPAKRNKNDRVVEPAFEHAGQKAGVETWRVESFKPVAVPQKDIGKFHTGDSYIVLSTQEKKKEKFWDIHFWLGSETSQDEAGSAAILTVLLDNQLGGKPVQHREVQDQESQAFKSLFKNGVSYLPGGVASGLKHVDRDQHETVMYQVKGKKNIRVKQVPVTVASMNNGDCFILDTGTVVYVYVGPQANRIEKLKAISAANQVRDQDHGGRPKVEIIDEFSSEADFGKFFAALGDGSRNRVPEASVAADDQQFEKSESSKTELQRVSEKSGKVSYTKVTESPLLQSKLDTNDCFILYDGSSLYVWIGRKSSPKEKSEAMNKAAALLKEYKLPNWTKIQRIAEGSEPAVFQQYFHTWKSQGETRTRLIREAILDPRN